MADWMRSLRPGATALCAAVLVLLVLPASALALMSTGDGGWQWLDPQPQGNDLGTVVALDAQHAVAAGSYGTMLTTSDGGGAWNERVPGVAGANVVELSFLNAQEGWALEVLPNVNKRIIVHTIDGGATWTIESTWPAGLVDFVDADHGWVLAGDVWSTSNGGRTWKRHGVAGDFSSIDFVDADHGWAAGSTSIRDDPNAGTTGAIFVTSDGGVTWRQQSFPGDTDQMNTVDFVNAKDGWACGQGSDMGGAGTIVATTDGGAHWTAQSAGTDGDLSGITFIDATHGWLPEGGSTYATTDGGTTWTAADSGLTSVSSVSFANDLDGYAVGAVGGLATTTDGGVTWQVRSSITPAGGFPLLSVLAFPNASQGWAIGGQSIFATSDGGATWSSQTVNANLAGLSFPDATNGWAVGATGGASVILHTTDGGQSWQSHELGKGLPSGFRGNEVVDFIDASHGWVTGASSESRWVGHPIVGRTTDGGADWRFSELRHALNVAMAVSFVDDQHGWVVCAPYNDMRAPSTIYRTTDGGLTWKLQDTTKRRITLRDVDFVDRLHGWAVGQNTGSRGACFVLSTTNGGRTWSARKLPVPGYYSAGQQVVFVDRLHGWIANDKLIYATTDGGRHWRAQKPGSEITALAFADVDHGWAAINSGYFFIGSGGILTTATGGFAAAP
jgi:photosystem II stability/assembly factor-like uncharacterized protein